MKTVLEARNIVKSFGGNTVLKGVDLQLSEGEIVLLQGANGSGKTTLINILTGNLEPEEGIIVVRNEYERQFRFPRPWYRSFLPFTYFSPERIAWSGMGRVWQDIRIFSTQSLCQNVAVATPDQPGESPCKVLFLPLMTSRAEKKNTREAKEMLEQFGLARFADLPASQVSFGYSKRVAIARALQAGAKILFLDEPLAGLDQAEADNVIAMLKELVDDHKITLVIVEHDINIPLIREIATKVWNLADGKITENSVQKDEQSKSSVLHDWLKSNRGPNGRYIEMNLDNGGRLTIAGNGKGGQRLLKLNQVTVHRRNRPVISEPLSFELFEGEIALLEAPNGWGKSTLFDAIGGLIPFHSGSMEIQSRDVTNAPTWERAQQGLHLARTQGALFTHLSVRENLELNRVTTSVMEDKKNQKAGSLSGGENRRLLIECALNAPAKTILLDEPFQALDSTTAEWLRQALLAKCTEQSAVFITSPKNNNGSLS